jgi:mannose-6-phosphate isomerase-like protein (cupin superfamily)
MHIKNFIPAAVAIVVLSLGAAAVHAQGNESPMADSNAAFAAIQPDSNGTTTHSVMHAPAGDVVAMYIGKLPQQVYTKQDNVLYIISGYGTASVGYPSFAIKPGSVISVPRNTAFQITATGSQPIKAIMIASPNDNPDNKKVF